MSGDHRQRGGKIGVCPECRSFVYSGQSSILVRPVPVATFAHTGCVHPAPDVIPSSVQARRLIEEENE